MAKVLLVNPPMLTKEGRYIDGYQGIRPKLPALGLAYLASVLEKRGHKVKIIEGMAESVSPEEIARISLSFDILGITSITFLMLLADEVVKKIKTQNKSIPIIMGGPHATVMPEDVLGDGNVDFVVMGEGENTLLELVEALESKMDIGDIKGIAYRKNGRVVFTEPRPILEDLDMLPLPARHLLPMRLYRSSEIRARRHPALHMMSSRGCPYNCSFCSNKVIHRCRLRLHSAERVLEEMCVLIKNYGAKEIHFWDDCFVFNHERVYKICGLLHQRKINVPWECEATMDRVTPGLLKEMQQAGCFSISYGIESGNDRRLKKMNKYWLNRNKIKEAIEWTRKAGLRVRGYFMFGFVGETLDEMEETIKFIKELKLDLATFALLVPLPGTQDYTRALTEGEFDPYYWRHRIVSEISFPFEPVYIPCGITKAQLLNIHRRAYREFYFRPKIILKRFFDLGSVRNFWGSLRGALIIMQQKK